MKNLMKRNPTGTPEPVRPAGHPLAELYRHMNDLFADFYRDFEDPARVPDRRGGRGGIPDVPLRHLQPPRRPGQVFPPAGGEVVQDADLMPGLKKLLDEMGADEASPACDEDFHFESGSRFRGSRFNG